jgi:hypothetical protein
VSPRIYAAITFSLLTIMAALLVSSLLGGFTAPRSVFAALIFAQGLIRFFHHARQPDRRGGSLVQLLISVVIAYLIVAAT